MNSLHAARREIGAALAAETRPWVRKRLATMQGIIDGQSPAAAAAAAGASPAAAQRWLRLVRNAGWAALLRDERGRQGRMTEPEVAAVRHEIDAALAGPLPGPRRQRLIALRLALSGALSKAAATAHVTPGTVRRWLLTLRRHGLAPFLPRNRRSTRSFVANAAVLRARAAEAATTQMRKRLIALACLADGLSLDAAAAEAGLTAETVRDHCRHFEEGGLSAVLARRGGGRATRPPAGRSPRPGHTMPPRADEATRQQIASALEQPLRPQLRARLSAIAMLLSGCTAAKAAASAGVSPPTVRRWLRTVRHRGAASAIESWQGRGPGRPPRLDADPARLRELAASELNPRVRKRMLALACIAEGHNAYDADAKVGLSPSAVYRSIRSFQAEGIAGLRDRKPAGRPPKLTAAELQALRHDLLQRESMSYRELQDLVHDRFGVRYACSGLHHLLKRELGIVFANGRFQERAKPMPLGLSPAHLQASLNGAQDPIVRRKLMLLLEAVEARDPDEVARARGLRPSLLRRWAMRYRSAGAAGLCGG